MIKFQSFLIAVLLCMGSIVYGQTYIQKVSGSGCAGTETDFTFTHGCSNVTWSASGAQIILQNSTTLNVKYNSAGTYSVSASYSGCSSSPTSGSDSYPSFTILPMVTPSVSIAITAGTNPSCQGTSVTFTATPTNGGSTQSYSWKVNGSTVYSGGNTYTTSSLANGDVVTTVMTPSASCVTQPTATSNAITMTVTPKPVVSVTIGGSALPLCNGLGTLVAQPQNAVNPTYTWLRNNTVVSTSNSYVVSASAPLNAGDLVVCVVNSQGCVSGSPANSSLRITTTSPIAPSINITPSTSNACAGANVTFTASPHDPGYTLSNYSWKLNGAQIGPNNSPVVGITGSAAASGDITVTATATGSCISSTSASGTMLHGSITARPDALAPNVPLVSSNTCYAKTLSYNGTPPTGTTWYWQGENSSGTDNTSATATNPTFTTLNQNGAKTYYIRGSLNNCWGPSTPVTITVDNPAPPNPNAFSYCEWDNWVLSTTGVASKLNWYNSANQFIVQSSQYTVPSGLLPGNYSYYAKNVSAAGCEGTSSSVINLLVRDNCDDNLNWTEEISYGIDVNGNQIETTHSKSYTNGLDNILQTQSKSFAANQVLATQPLYNSLSDMSAATLPAPINSTDFIYRYRFATNTSGKPYGPNEFDQRTTPTLTNPGEIKNPLPVGNNTVGSLGWYYSANNTLEPLTATTNYPYSRIYTPEGPNPLTSSVSRAGDNTTMGSGHEGTVQKQTFLKSELQHYFSLRGYFVSTVLPSQLGPNLMNNNDGSTITGFLPYYTNTLSTIVQNGETYVMDLTPSPLANGQVFSGVFPIGTSTTNQTYSVLPNTTYTFRVKGYNTSTSPVVIMVRNAVDNTNIKFPGPSMNSYDSWIEYTFTTPANCTSVKFGLICQNPKGGDIFYINELEFFQVLSVENAILGYKTTNIDSDGLSKITFTDFNGRVLASAIKNTDGSYGNWSYAYYNDLGQKVATVAPLGVVIGNATYPKYVTLYKYDNLGHVIEQTDPDTGTSRFLYDSDGKIRFSQSQIQRDATPSRFSYSNYDYLGRIVESGEYTSSGTNPYIFEAADIKTAPQANSVLNIVDRFIPSGKDIETITMSDYPALSQRFDATRCTDYVFVKYDLQALDYVSDTKHTRQTNLLGKISKTWNDHFTTWYSYDEFGQLVWTKQNFVDLGYKTVNYYRDFAGHATWVVYQSLQSTEKFYHHYLYDGDQRISQVMSGRDSLGLMLQATYKYYTHGPLKRIELAGNKQGIDYVYTIDGVLKSINSSDPMKDPGQDGYPGVNSAFGKDVFGETIHYNDSDYSGASYDAGSLSLNGTTYPNRFSGVLRASSYNNTTDLLSDGSKARHLYAYSYDQLNQLTNAQWGNVVGSTVTTGENQRESLQYDKNGNITTLLRKGKQAQTTGNFTYVYEANTNRLDKVTSGGTVSTDYSYNSSGQMIAQTEGGKTMNVVYNVYGLVKEIRDANNQLMMSYTYDDNINLAKKTLYNSGSVVHITWYVRSSAGSVMSIYEQDISDGLIKQTELPVYGKSRISTYKPLVNTYFYEVCDHLGNVRALIGVPSATSYSANFETQNQSYEQTVFRNYSRSNFDLMDHTDPGTTYTYSQLLNGGNNSQVGLSKSLPVTPGDKISVNVYAKYLTNTGGAPVDINTFATALTNAFGVTSTSVGEAARIYSALNTYGLSVGNGTAHSSSGSVGGWATILLFDKNYTLVDASWRPVDPTLAAQDGTSAIKASHQQINWEMTVSQPGYAFVFLSNESHTQVDIYFDDLTITQTQSPVVAGSDFYPFGLPMDGMEIKDEPYRYGYQGRFSEKDLTNGWNEFELRMYDARYGRWLSPDPLRQFASPYVAMGNNPTTNVDVNGGWSGGGGEIGSGLAKSMANEAMDRFELEMASMSAVHELPPLSLPNIPPGGYVMPQAPVTIHHLYTDQYVPPDPRKQYTHAETQAFLDEIIGPQGWDNEPGAPYHIRVPRTVAVDFAPSPPINPFIDGVAGVVWASETGVEITNLQILNSRYYTAGAKLSTQYLGHILTGVGLALTAWGVWHEMEHDQVGPHTYINLVIEVTGFTLTVGLAASAPVTAFVIGAVVGVYGVITTVTEINKWYDNEGREIFIKFISNHQIHQVY